MSNEKMVSVETMRLSDAWTIANRISSKELMRRAGAAIFEAGDWKAPVAIICGKGNNAGDGYVAAELMKRHGIDCTIVLVSDNFSEDGRYYYDSCIQAGVKVEQYDDSMDFREYGSVLDCLLGTGFKGEVTGVMKEVIEKINDSGAYVVSADINSGLNGDTGLGVTYVRSDLTVSIGSYKYGHFKGLSAIAMKNKVNCDIGIEIQEEAPIVVTCAMDYEFYKLVEQLSDSRERYIGDYKFVEGKLDGYPVVIIRSLMGMVNAAAVSSIAIREYNPYCLIVQGMAGGHNIELSQGDIVLGKDMVEFGSYYSYHKNEGEGSDYRSWSYVGQEALKNGRVIRLSRLHSDERLMNIAESVKYDHGNIIRGTIGTADAWNKEIDRILYIREKFGTDCEEMEGFAAANICRQFNVPFLAIRIISNSELYPEQEFNEVYAFYCQEFALNVIKAIIKEIGNK